MSAYVLVSYDINDQEHYQGYVPAVLPLLQKHGAEILVADFDPRGIEGTARHVYVVLKFESDEAAMNFYNDPEYQPVKQIRLDSTENGSMVLTKQFELPSS